MPGFPGTAWPFLQNSSHQAGEMVNVLPDEADAQSGRLLDQPTSRCAYDDYDQGV